MPSVSDGIQHARLSTQQRRAWALAVDGRTVPHVSGQVRLTGPCDRARLAHAWRDVAARHEILRTRFVRLATTVVPVQAIEPAPRREAIGWCALDQLSDDQQQDALSRLARVVPAFDLEAAPPIRVIVAELSGTSRVATVTASALMADRRGLAIALKEWRHAYDARACEDPDPDPDPDPDDDEPPLQYADYAEWQHEVSTSDDSREARAYWEQDPDAPFEAATLPAGRLPSAAGGPSRGGILTREIDPARRAALATAAAAWTCSIDTLLLACWALLLSRLTDQPDVRVAVAFDGRGYDDLGRIPGCFTRFLRVALPSVTATPSGEPTLRTLADALQRRCATHRHWQDAAPADVEGLTPWTFEYVPERAEDVPDDAIEPASTTPDSIPGDAFPPLQAPPPIDRLDMQIQDIVARLERSTVALTIFDRADGARVEWSYDAASLDRPAIARVAEEYETLLAQIDADRPVRLCDLQFTGPREREHLLALSAGPAAALPDAASIQMMIAAAAARASASPAVVTAETRLSYAELYDWSNQLANHLRHLGLRAESRVVVCFDRSAELIVAMLGVLGAGAAFVPLDPGYPPERRRFVLEHARAAAVLTSNALASRFADFDGPCVCLDRDDSLICRVPDWPPRIASYPEQTAYVIYTSGSTGRPKGVAVTQRGLIHSTDARTHYYGGRVERFLLLSSPSFDSAMAGIFWTLCDGGTLVVPSDRIALDVAALSRLIASERVTHLLALPSLYALLLAHGDRDALAPLRVVIVAGESCPETLADAHARILPETRLYNEYGPTEGTVWSTAHQVHPGPRDGRVPIGRPIARVQAYVMDDAVSLSPAGAMGELGLAGAGIARGYLASPGLTAAAFVPHPWSATPGARVYRTGDRVRRRADGSLEFHGRRDHQIKIRGYRVELEDIEAVLRRHPDTADVVTVAREDTPGAQRLVAYIVPRRGGEPEAGDDGAARREAPVAEHWRAFAAERLPDYMVPLCVLLPSLPVTPNGKVDRAALPAPEALSEGRTPFVPPSNETEARIAAIWQELLKRDAIGIHDNFFDLGGHSLLAVPLHERLMREVSSAIGLLDLFEHPTVHALAAHVLGLGTAAVIAPDQARGHADARREALGRRRARATGGGADTVAADAPVATELKV